MSTPEQKRAWRLANPERSAAAAKKYNKAHPERRKAQYAAYRTANRNKVRAASAKWGRAHNAQIVAQNRIWRAANPEKVRAQKLKFNFGVTGEQYSELFAKQNGLCAVCKQPEKAVRGGAVKWLAVDHAHDTGEVRALLCQSCNIALGLLNEDPERLLAARDYLLRYRPIPS